MNKLSTLIAFDNAVTNITQGCRIKSRLQSITYKITNIATCKRLGNVV